MDTSDWLAILGVLASLVVSGFALYQSGRATRAGERSADAAESSAADSAKSATAAIDAAEHARRSANAAERSAEADERAVDLSEAAAISVDWTLHAFGETQWRVTNTGGGTAYGAELTVTNWSSHGGPEGPVDIPPGGSEKFAAIGADQLGNPRFTVTWYSDPAHTDEQRSWSSALTR